MRGFLKYKKIVELNLKAQIIFPSRFVAGILTFSIRTFVLLLLYSYAFSQKGGEVNGVTTVTALWSIAMYFIFMYTGARDAAKDILDDVHYGNIETKINRPWSYLLYMSASSCGKAFPLLIISTIVAIPVLLIFAGKPEITLSLGWFSYVVIIFALGFILGYLFYLLISLSTFWLEDSKPLYWISDKLVMIFGGSYVPVAIFPDTFRTIAESSPFGAIVFTTHIFYNNFIENAPRLILVQFFWVIILFYLLNFLMRKALYRLSVNGG